MVASLAYIGIAPMMSMCSRSFAGIGPCAITASSEGTLLRRSAKTLGLGRCALSPSLPGGRPWDAEVPELLDFAELQRLERPLKCKFDILLGARPYEAAPPIHKRFKNYF